MSWQAYVDSNMVGTGKITAGAILGLDGNPWALSPGLSLLPAETAALLTAFKDATSARTDGLTLAGKRNVVFRSDERSIYGKAGKDGVVAVKTGQAVLIGFYKDPIVPGEATKVVEALADYLISVGLNGYLFVLASQAPGLLIPMELTILAVIAFVCQTISTSSSPPPPPHTRKRNILE